MGARFIDERRFKAIAPPGEDRLEESSVSRMNFSPGATRSLGEASDRKRKLGLSRVFVSWTFLLLFRRSLL